MPATDLKAMREFVANILDYEPSNAKYKTEVDQMLNEADRRVCSEKPWPWINKQVQVTARQDVSATVTFTNGSAVITTAAAFFDFAWMAGQIISDGTTELEIAWISTTTQAYLTNAYVGTTGAKTATVINRYLDLPADCVAVLNVFKRSESITPSDPGMLDSLARYEDEWYNLPLGEINMPKYWVPYDPFYLSGPRRGFATGTAVAVGSGVRTVEVCCTYRYASTRESAYGAVQTVSLTAVQDLSLNFDVLSVTTGLYKIPYWRCPTEGLYAWRRCTNASTGEYLNIEPNDGATYVVGNTTLSNIQSEAIWLQDRMQNPDGNAQRIRLYPRQDRDYVFEVRYIARHQTMVEDGDVSAVPADHRMIVAYRALADLFIKHDNETQSAIYKRKADDELLKMERRYLIPTARRIVKGNWDQEAAPWAFQRYTRLTHT
jgi:hypothetical protein